MNLAWRFLVALSLWVGAAVLGWWLRLPSRLPVPSQAAAEAILANADSGRTVTNAAATAQRVIAADPWSLSGLAPRPTDSRPATTTGAETALWRLAALGLRGKVGFAVLTAPGQTPLRLAVGDALPDGDKIKSIHADRIEVLSPRGRTRTLYLIEP
jgi:Type II secretion system protein C